MKEFIKKEFRYILRDRWTTIIILVLPIVMIILFGYGITTETKNTHFNVVDQSRTNASSQLVDRLQQSEYFTLDRYMSAEENVDAVLNKSDVGLVVVIPASYDHDLAKGSAEVQLIADGSDPNTSSTLVNYATAVISQAAMESAAARIPHISCETRMLYNPTLKGAYNTVPGVMGMIFMLICTMMTSISIAREKEKGSMEVLLVSPVRPSAIVLAKMVPYFAISLFNLVVMLTLSVFVMKVPINGSLALLLLVSVVFIIVCLALGVLISIVSPSQIVAMLVSAVIMLLPTMLLSGMLFPVETMPLFFRILARIVPATWYIDMCRSIMIQGVDIGSIAGHLAVLTALAAVLFAVSVKRFNRRLE